mgnify:CR=1 FL=1
MTPEQARALYLKFERDFSRAIMEIPQLPIGAFRSVEEARRYWHSVSHHLTQWTDLLDQEFPIDQELPT